MFLGSSREEEHCVMSLRRAVKETNLSQSIVEKTSEGFIPYWIECYSTLQGTILD